MARRGRLGFLRFWHDRQLPLDDGATLHWVLIANPRAPAPHAECFRVVEADGTSRGLHPDTARRILIEHNHPDAEHVPMPSAGRTFTH